MTYGSGKEKTYFLQMKIVPFICSRRRKKPGYIISTPGYLRQVWHTAEMFPVDIIQDQFGLKESWDKVGVCKGTVVCIEVFFVNTEWSVALTSKSLLLFSLC